MARPNINLPPGALDSFRSSAEGIGNLYRNLGSSPDQFYGALGDAYQQSFKGPLDFNMAMFKGSEEGYKNLIASQGDANDLLGRGYQGMYDTVLGGLEGYGRSQRNQIADAYAQQSGAASQGLINRGLGNSTIQSAVQRGLFADQQKANIDLGDRIQQQRAGIQQNILGQQLGAQERGQGALSNLGLDQLRWMNSVGAPYPDVGMFGQLAQQYGATQQQNKDREAALQAAAAAGATPRIPQSAGTVSRGGGGWERPSPFGNAGGGGAQIGSGGFLPPPRPQRPQAGSMGAMNQKAPSAWADFYTADRNWNSMYGDAAVMGNYGQSPAPVGGEAGFGGYGGLAEYGLSGPTSGFSGGFGSQLYGAASPYDLSGEDMPYGQAPIPFPYGAPNAYQSGDYGYAGGNLDYGTQSSQDYFGY